MGLENCPKCGKQYDAALNASCPLCAGDMKPPAADEAKAPVVGDVKAPAVDEAKAPVVGDVKAPAVSDGGGAPLAVPPAPQDAAKGQEEHHPIPPRLRRKLDALAAAQRAKQRQGGRPSLDHLLARCAVCGEAVSMNAPSCPHCGQPIASIAWMWVRRGYFLGLGMGLLAALVWILTQVLMLAWGLR